MSKTDAAAAEWTGVLRSEDAVCGEVVPVRLLDRELAIWRTATGTLEAWEDRCPHRGTRLTLGTNTGTEVVCRYHGWRFAAGNAACTFVPAHPAQIPPKNAAVRRYRCDERYGLVWVSTHGVSDLAPVPALEPATPSFTVRSVTLDAGVEGTEKALAAADRAERAAAGIMVATVQLAGESFAVVYVLAPQSEIRTEVHGIVMSPASGAERLAILRAHNERMKSLVRRTRADLAVAG